MTATHDDHDDSDDNRCVCNMTLSFYFTNDGDDDGNRHHIKNDAVITILSLSLITPPFDPNIKKVGKYRSNAQLKGIIGVCNVLIAS